VPEIGTALFDEAGGRRFCLLRKLGAGSFGSVWLASVTSPSGLEQRVAVKLLHGAGDVDAEAVDRLRDEAMVLANLHHPVILVAHDLVQLRGLVQFGDRIALVTEYVEGRDFSRCIHDDVHPIPVSAALDVVGQVASALDAAWSSLGIVHRDIKPANIRVGRHGNVKLLDFGIARSDLLARSAHTVSNGLVGSAGFLAPERFETERPLHPGSDMFSLGCVLYEAATRERFFERLEAPQIMRLGLSRSRFDPYVERRLKQPMPPAVYDLLARMLLFDPDARADAATVSRLCDRALAHDGEATALRQWCRSYPWDEPPQAEARREPTRSDPTWTESSNSVPLLEPAPAPAAPALVERLPLPPPPEAWAGRGLSPSSLQDPGSDRQRAVRWALATSGTLLLLGLGAGVLGILAVAAWLWSQS
jgi:serine/threonine protein kinase